MRKGFWPANLNAVAALCICISQCSCTYDVAEEMRPLPEHVSFSQHIIPMFNTYCNIPDCHSGIDPTGNLNLEADSAYEHLFEQHEINTATPTFSVLYVQLNSTNPTMPPTGRLDDYYIALVLKWIKEGAVND